MRWMCPDCGRPVSLALTECPYCAAEAEEKQEAPAVETATTPEPPPPPPPIKPAPAAPPAPAVRPEPVPIKPSPPPAPSPVRRVPAIEPLVTLPRQPESAFRRGLRLGVGFMLAVVTILFLLVLLLDWLSLHPGWLPRWPG